MHSWCHLSKCEIPAQWQITTDTTNPQFIFLAVDNDSRDLLVHEDQYCSEKCWQDRSKYPVPPDVKWVHEPTTHRRRRLIQHTCTEHSHTTYVLLPAHITTHWRCRLIQHTCGGIV